MRIWRQLALKYKTPDVYRVHHGNISAVLREQAEDEMKNSEEKLVTGATVTLESASISVLWIR